MWCMVHMKKIKLYLSIIISFIVIAFFMENYLEIIYPLKYEEYVYKYSCENYIDPYLTFAIIKAESGFQKMAHSNKNARGLMQITEGTAKWGAESLNIEKFEVEKLFNPEINIKIGTWYLNKLMNQFNDDIELVIAAYNGGSGNVSEWLKDSKLSFKGEKLEKIPFKETEEFVKKVKKYYIGYKNLYVNMIKI